MSHSSSYTAAKLQFIQNASTHNTENQEKINYLKIFFLDTITLRFTVNIYLHHALQNKSDIIAPISNSHNR